MHIEITAKAFKLWRHALFFLWFGILSQTFIKAQSAHTLNIIPSSPVSASIERYNDYPVSLYTGVPEINIPIYEITSGDIQLPLSISYHASGIKVTDVSYPVGLGWTLNAGGRISRSVRGLIDEVSVSRGAVFSNPYPSTVNKKMMMENMDAEPDLYFYSLGTKESKSGRFLFDGLKSDSNGVLLANPVFIPASDMKFSHVVAGQFNLTDENGKVYKFGMGNQETTPSGSHINNYQLYTSAWLLTEILPASKNVNDKVSFTYNSGPVVWSTTTEGSISVVDSVTKGITSAQPGLLLNLNAGGQQERFLRIDGCAEAYINYPTMYSPANSTVNHNYNSRNLATIQFKGGYVEFIYSTDNLYLNQIKVFSADNKLIRVAQFYYGSYNSWDRFRLDSVLLKGEGSEKQKYVFDYEAGIYQEMQMRYYNARDHWDYYNGITANSTPIPRFENVPVIGRTRDDNGNNIVLITPSTIGTANRETVENELKRYVIKKISYPTGGYTEFEFEANKYLDDQNPGNIILKDVGGLRVKTIKSYDGINDPLIKNYKYGITGPSDIGAGVPFQIPRYEDYINEYYILYPYQYNANHWTYTGYDIFARQKEFLSSPANQLTYIDGCPVWYTYVEESQTTTSGVPIGKTTYTFKLPQRNTEAHYTSYYGAIRSKYNFVSTGFSSPQLIEKKTYKSSGASYIPVAASRYEYVEINRGGGTANYPFHTTMRLQEPPGSVPGQPMNPDNKYDEINWSVEEVVPLQFFLTNEANIAYVLNSQSALDSIVENITYQYGTDHLLTTAISKSTSQGWVYKSFKYPPDYKNLSAQDMLTLGVKNLQLNNCISTPVEEYTSLYKNNSFIGVTQSKLNSFKTTQPFLDKVYTIESTVPRTNFSESAVINGGIVIDPAYKSQFEVDSYNAEGRVTQQHLTNNIHKSYLWGYKNMYPVAEVTGAGYNTISALVNQSILDNPASDEALRAELANLRNGLASSKALVTTYTYKPLVGMTSQTDPNGKTVYYYYDAMGRLFFIRDQNGHVIKKFCYNYAGQPETCTLFFSAPVNASYYSQTCGSGLTPDPYYVSIAEGMFTGNSAAEANQQAQAYAQVQANEHSTCSAPMIGINAYDLTGYSYIVSLTNVNTEQSYFFETTEWGNVIIGYVPEGTYNITISGGSYNNVNYSAGCNHNTSSNSGASFYGVEINNTCRYINTTN